MPEISLDSYLKLTGAGNWHTWFEEFKGYATLNGIWKYVDPDGTREPEHDAPEPLTFERARERLLERAQKLSAKGTTPTPESSQAQMPTGDTPTSVREPTQDEIDREYNRLKDEFLIHSQAQTEAVNCITNLQRWVTAAVDPKIYDTARTKKKFDTNDFNVTFKYAQQNKIMEIQGTRALEKFLEAIGTRLEPEWAVQMKREIKLAEGHGKPIPTLEELAKSAKILITNENTVRCS
ncbi:hypothetical protein VTH82DRAFT_3945 [Thermothelomyces myriococcoides]